MFAERPDLRTRVDLYQHGRRANHEYAEVGDAQIHQEDVCAVPHILTAQHDQRYLRNIITTESFSGRFGEREICNLFSLPISQRDIETKLSILCILFCEKML